MQLSKSIRFLALLSGVGVLALLLTARILEPAAEGYGTHRQLGFPPCSSLVLFGTKCPACGMTTSWSMLLRGQISGAIRANVGGLMIGLIAMAYLPTSCYLFLSGRTSRRGLVSLAFGCSLLIAMTASILQWAFRLAE